MCDFVLGRAVIGQNHKTLAVSVQAACRINVREIDIVSKTTPAVCI
tara:strand:- start:8126 stop:8263 length:138 start_codon:yes stop_codon:yes gene_type:complete